MDISWNSLPAPALGRLDLLTGINNTVYNIEREWLIKDLSFAFHRLFNCSSAIACAVSTPCAVVWVNWVGLGGTPDYGSLLHSIVSTPCVVCLHLQACMPPVVFPIYRKYSTSKIESACMPPESWLLSKIYWDSFRVTVQLKLPKINYWRINRNINCGRHKQQI